MPKAPPRSSSPREAVGDSRTLHRACNGCRTHRVKCIPVDGEEKCRRCLERGVGCDKTSAPPKDDRPRRRLLFRDSGSAFQGKDADAYFMGSSSIPLLAWKVAPQRPDVIDKFRSLDDRFSVFRGSVGGLEQDGLLVRPLTEANNKADKPALVSVALVRGRLIQELGAETVLSSLYATCRDRIIPFFPVVSVSESLLTDKVSEEHVSKFAAIDPNSVPPTPLPNLVRMIHCAIAARSRDVPEHIRQSLLSAVHGLRNGPEITKIIASRSLASIQVLLSLSVCDDLNNPDANEALEVVWQNVGAAARIGFGIALHRNVSPSQIPYYQLNRRFRVWGACIIMDRWQAVRLGRVVGISTEECDAPHPRHYADGIREGDLSGPSAPGPNFPCFRFLSELTSLSILLGRAYKLVGNPHGLQAADDLSFILLQIDIDAWHAQLPTSWPYSINLSLRQAPSLLNLFAVAVEFTLQRCFIWPAAAIPASLTFRPSPDRWLSLCQRAEQATYWLNTPDGAFYLDVFSVSIYPAFCCLMIHIKAFSIAKDSHHRWLVETAHTTIQQWAAVAPGNTVRAQLAGSASLLYSAAMEDDVANATMDQLYSQALGTVQPSLSPIASTSFNHLDFDAMGLDPVWFENV